MGGDLAQKLLRERLGFADSWWQPSSSEAEGKGEGEASHELWRARMALCALCSIALQLASLAPDTREQAIQESRCLPISDFATQCVQSRWLASPRCYARPKSWLDVCHRILCACASSRRVTPLCGGCRAAFPPGGIIPLLATAKCDLLADYHHSTPLLGRYSRSFLAFTLPPKEIVSLCAQPVPYSVCIPRHLTSPYDTCLSFVLISVA